MDMMPACSSEIAEQIKDIGRADVMLAIPAHNNEKTIGRVMKEAAEGLSTFFDDKKCAIFVCEGGSLDETKKVALSTDVGVTVSKAVGTYRGEPGKGNALRAVFHAARMLEVGACALVDADMRSMTPEWVNNLLEPVVREDYDYVAPFYRRYKYDGTITNSIVYPLMTSLYGKRLRQPIGGDFGLSGDFIDHLAKRDVWDKYVSQFGIDVWMTICAITGGHKICQARLGAKIHDAKDPAFALGPMYMQVLSTLFRSMSKFQELWLATDSFDDVAVRGTAVPWEPEPVPISVTRCVEEFNMGMDQFGSLYRDILSDECYEGLIRVAHSETCRPDRYCDFYFPPDLWARVIYDLAVTFNCWKGNTHKLIDISSPLYFAKVASFANATTALSHEEDERVVEEDVRVFEAEKDYLVRRWKELGAGAACSL